MITTSSQLVIFYHVVVNSSFSKAAQRLNCSKAYISKEIARLENTVGSLLLQRNTRSITLTFAGETLFEHAKAIVQEFKAAENSIASLQSKVAGNLRITAPLAYTDCMLAPALPDFLKQHPELTLDMLITSSVLNLVEENIDVAIRLTHEPPLDRVAKRVGEYQMIICAAPDYFKNQSLPKKPNDLLDKRFLVYASERNSHHWPFIINQKITKMVVRPYLSSNNCNTLLNAAINGLGIARLPNYVVKDAIRSGQLIGLLPDNYPPAIPIYAIYAQGRILPPKIHAFTKFLQEIHL